MPITFSVFSWTFQKDVGRCSDPRAPTFTWGLLVQISGFYPRECDSADLGLRGGCGLPPDPTQVDGAHTWQEDAPEDRPASP